MVNTAESTAARPPRDRNVLAAALIAFALWLLAIGPVRTWAAGGDAPLRWVVGVAPSFFAGLWFAFWPAFISRTSPVVSVAGAVVLVTLAEAVQLFLPRYTADVWDVVAGMFGVATALPVLLWRARKSG